MDYITSFDVNPTEVLLNQLFDALPSNVDSKIAYLMAERADAWSFVHWQDTGESIVQNEAGQLPHATEDTLAQWLVNSTAGRWFSPDAQLTWRRILIGDEYRLRMVSLSSDESFAASLTEVPKVSDVLLTSTDDLGLRTAATMEQFILWGQQSPRTPGEWIELSIPHRFRYPWPSKIQMSSGTQPAQLALSAIRWGDAVGRTHFVRYTGLVEVGSSTELADDDSDDEKQIEVANSILDEEVADV